MLPDPGSYEEGYSLTGAALSLAAALLSVSLGLLWHTHLIFAALTVLLAIPTVLAAVRGPVAFRADHAGITLGSEWQLPRRVMVIPWADVEKIILYSGYTSSGDQAQYIGVQRPQGAPALPYGNKQALWCPVPGVAAGADPADQELAARFGAPNTPATLRDRADARGVAGCGSDVLRLVRQDRKGQSRSC